MEFSQGPIARLGLKKKLVRFRFPTDPAQLRATEKFFEGFERFKKKFHKTFIF